MDHIVLRVTQSQNSLRLLRRKLVKHFVVFLHKRREFIDIISNCLLMAYLLVLEIDLLHDTYLWNMLTEREEV